MIRTSVYEVTTTTTTPSSPTAKFSTIGGAAVRGESGKGGGLRNVVRLRSFIHGDINDLDVTGSIVRGVLDIPSTKPIPSPLLSKIILVDEVFMVILGVFVWYASNFIYSLYICISLYVLTYIYFKYL